jgi:hypothetical protein
MWNDSDDVLDLDTTPEMKEAAHLLNQAGDEVAEDTLPLKKLEALCSLRCFDKIKDHWSMSAVEKKSVVDCIEKCEEPMESIGEVLENERNRLLEVTTDCLERCRDNDEICANKCITQSISNATIQSMLARVRARIVGYKYS